jgi:alpha-D-xyloside xylohydrolase
MVDHTWPGPPLAEPPAGLRGLENFSGRWQGFIVAGEDGEHEIGAEADDGQRLWLDGKLVAEDWNTGGMRFKGVKISLKKGQRVAFKLDYYQGTGGRGLRLGWRTPSQLAAGPAPVDNTVETYLPEGADWYDFWTNQRHTGGRRVTTACPLDRFPLFVRAGSLVPMSPAMQYVTEKPSAPYEIRVYPGADATFTLYEDDGETYAYEKGRRATVELRWDEKAKTLSIGQRQGSFPGMVAEREFRVVLASETAGVGLPESTDSRSVRYDGRALQIEL